MMATPALSSAPSSVVPSLVMSVRPEHRVQLGVVGLANHLLGSPGRTMSPPA